MKISTGDDVGDDSDECPHCQAWIYELADEVSDGDWNGKDKDVAGIDCPACGVRIALVRTHSYSLHKIKARGEA